MSDTPAKDRTETETAALFESWLKPLQPAHPSVDGAVAAIAPFRRHFLDAAKRGYGWNQLAKEVASKPEIGVKLTGISLKRCVAKAFEAAGEPLPRTRKSHRSSAGKSAAKNSKPAPSAPAAPANAKSS